MLHKPAGRIRALGTAATLATAIALLAGACSSSGASATPKADASPNASGADTTVTFVTSGGAVSFTSDLGYEVAVARGYFKDNGINIKSYIQNGGGAANLPPLIHGQAQAGYLSLATTIEADAQNPGANLVEGASTQLKNNSFPVLTAKFLASRGIDPKEFATWPLTKRIETIKGAKWGISQPGGYVERWTDLLIEGVGLSPQDITTIPNPPNYLAELQAGQLDGYNLQPADYQPLVADGTVALVVRPDELEAYNKTLYYDKGAEFMIDDNWFKSHPDVAKRFFAAYQKGVDFLFAHTPQEVYDVLKSGAPGFDEKKAIAQLTATIPTIPPDSKATDASLQAQIDFSVQSGAIKSADGLTPANVADFSYLPAPNTQRTDW